MSNHKMVLRVKSPENSKAKRRKEDVDEDYEAPKRSQTVKKKANSKSKNKSTDFDPKKPKKPPTAFFYFLEDFRKGYQEQNPNVKSMRDIGKACGEKWKTMTYEEKVQYYDIATEKRAEFERALQEYNKKKELGEDEESEDDSEFDE